MRDPSNNTGLKTTSANSGLPQSILAPPAHPQQGVLYGGPRGGPPFVGGPPTSVPLTTALPPGVPSGHQPGPPNPNQLTLTQLNDMAMRQQHQIEAQQQMLVAKEQRLKYLRQQDFKHNQMSAEYERLRRLREKVQFLK